MKPSNDRHLKSTLNKNIKYVFFVLNNSNGKAIF